mgnify:CR=1 FL=1
MSIEFIQKKLYVESRLFSAILARIKDVIREKLLSVSDVYVYGLLIHDQNGAEYLEVFMAANGQSDYERARKKFDEGISVKWDWHYWADENPRVPVFGGEYFDDDGSILVAWVEECVANGVNSEADQLERFWGLVSECGGMVQGEGYLSGHPIVIGNGVTEEWSGDATFLANPNGQAKEWVDFLWGRE